MFNKLEHDFGVVARGADTRYRLKITNKYQPAVHIAEVKTSCGCTAAKPSKDLLASLETAYIEITMDTKKFQQQKDSSVTVVIDQPQYAEVRIPIKAYIRPDVVLTPGERKTVNVVVRGKKPFAIEKIESEKSSGTFEVRLPQGSKPGNTYVLPLTVIAPDQPGTLTEDFTVTIAGSSEPVTFKAYGK